MQEQGLEFQTIEYVREAEIRYTMQMAEVTTPVPAGVLDAEAIDAVGAEFEALYERLYGKGSGFADAGLQVITYRVRAVGMLPIRTKLPDLEIAAGVPESSGTRRVFLDVRKGWQETKIYDYQALKVGAQVDGPAVVETPTTTIAVPEGSRGTVDRLGNLVLRPTAA